ncbi:MAG: sensor histidine kinase [Alphaproteobacteria bacterium]
MSGNVQSSGSIRRRLTLQLVMSAAVLATILFVLVQNFARQVAEESQDATLTASVTSILDSTTVRAGEVLVDIPYAALSMLGNVSDDRVFYRVMAGDAYLTGYTDLPEVDLADGQGEIGFLTADYRGEDIRMVTASRRLSVNGQPVKITASVAQTRNGQAATLARISLTAAYLGLGFFIVAVFLGLLAAQSSVRPLKQLARSVSRRGPRDLRPVEAPVPGEMVPLVISLNNFIERLKTSLARSEDFIAEAAHRVRTPLATVRTQAEIALRRVERPENRKSLKEMIRAIDESSRAAGQLLDHAMVTFRTDHLEAETFSITDLVEDAVERLRPVADLKDITLRFAAAPVGSVTGDPILVENAIRNILDNAVKYSPEDQEVEVRVNGAGAFAEVSVIDHGAGFPPLGADRLTERFARGSNVAATVGSGLGLTIAKEVAEAHGGRLSIHNHSEGPGACVSLYFPFS